MFLLGRKTIRGGGVSGAVGVLLFCAILRKMSILRKMQHNRLLEAHDNQPQQMTYSRHHYNSPVFLLGTRGGGLVVLLLAILLLFDYSRWLCCHFAQWQHDRLLQMTPQSTTTMTYSRHHYDSPVFLLGWKGRGRC